MMMMMMMNDDQIKMMPLFLFFMCGGRETLTFDGVRDFERFFDHHF